VKKIMKKLILIIALVLMLTMSAFAGVIGVYDLTGYYSSNFDFRGFLASPEVDTPPKMCAWMEANFIHTRHTAAYTPYQQWIYKTKGDCNDMSTFFLYYFFENFSGKHVKQIYIRCNENTAHMISAYYWYWVGPFYYTSNQHHYGPFDSYADCVADWDSRNSKHSVKWYNIYDYDLNLVQSSKSPTGVPDIAPSCLE